MRLERRVELYGVHAGDTGGEIPREHTEAGTDLEHDVVRRELCQPADHAEDVLVDEKVLAEPLLRRDVHAGSAKHSAAFSSICRSSLCGSSPRACASAASVCTT